MKQANRPTPERRDRLLRENVHDPYQTRAKPAEPSACPDCGAVYHKGGWRWRTAPADAAEVVCPACHRIRDGYPAGTVTLTGAAYLARHGQEIRNLMRNLEAAEKERHPLQRIMAIADTDDGLTVTTTDVHLPRRIGQALHRAHKGDVDTHYDEEGYFIRVDWQAPA
ncbi:MAG: BCAM0308 family protein [Alphaproteobacteria bacterium]|jgi:hypothetical protein|nr:BCAM0308 family protein [Alphaproteobacteria bacterium]